MDGYQRATLLLVLFVALCSHDEATVGATGTASIVLLPSLLNESVAAFDGAESSDLAYQFYQRYVRGESVESFNSSVVSTLPDTIARRLARLNVSTSSFTQLPGLLQRAVVWDSGFVLDAKSSSAFVQVWTTQGRSMAEIVVSRQEITESSTSTGSPQCPLTQCTQPNNSSSNSNMTTSYKTSECTCETLIRVSTCAIAAVAELEDLKDTPSLLWASGADPSAIPWPRIAEHRCQADSTTTNSSNTTQLTTVYSIHTALMEMSTGCSSTQFDSLVIPCVRMPALNSIARARMKEPKPSAWVDSWLMAAVPLIEAQTPSNVSTPSPSSSSTSGSSSSFKIVWLIPIVMGSLVVIALLGFFAIRYTGPQHHKSNRGVTTNSSIDVSALLSPRSKDYE